MKFIINDILVVEGKGDASYLSSFIDAEYVVTNGFDVDNQVQYLKAASKIKKIIIMTDSDESGEKIRQKLNNSIENCANVVVDINKCNKNNKHGVAECSKEEIISKLKAYFSLEKLESTQHLEQNVIILLESKAKREKVCKAFDLGNCNSKTTIKRLKTLQISTKQVLDVLGE